MTFNTPSLQMSYTSCPALKEKICLIYCNQNLLGISTKELNKLLSMICFGSWPSHISKTQTILQPANAIYSCSTTLRACIKACSIISLSLCFINMIDVPSESCNVNFFSANGLGGLAANANINSAII